MIDTIVLTLKAKEFQVTNPELFRPNANLILNSKSIGLIAKQNPTKKELKHGIYKPHLTISKRLNSLKFHEPMLKIELSLPKLIFGNNFEELRYKDFNSILNKLVYILYDMGIKTSYEILSNAQVSSIHYSKNFVFTDGTIPYHYINKIREANLKLSLDVNQTDYRNAGHSFKWHCNSYEIVFYDKIKDLEKAKQSSKRAIEKDSLIQLDLFKKLYKLSKLEVLRMEVRLTKKDKIKQLFKKLNIKSNLTFRKLFKPALSKKILLHYFDEIEKRRISLIDFQPESDKELLANLIVNNSELKFRKILQILGFKRALSFTNIRELRNMFSSYNIKGWNKFLSDINKIKLDSKNNSLKELRHYLEEFKPVKL
ncbi:hypothetical protein A3F66_04400 [candidate division TM6 bacterium RIFCSPHIGHO2_12_FULL_32_22]|nr:MAG: hypothetical protein A3F66_04400 [candidate division TM6 bacterium RIFCSPHIGHO2_12_FULL_32_22]